MSTKTILYMSGLVLIVTTIASGAAHDVSNISFGANSTGGMHIKSTYSANGGFLVVTDGTTYEYAPGALKIYQVVGSQKRLMATAIFDQNDLFEKSVEANDRALFWSKRLNAGIGADSAWIGADSACVLAAKGDVTVKVTGNFVPLMLTDGESLFAVDARSSIRISNNWQYRVKVANATGPSWSVSYKLTENRALSISISSMTSGSAGGTASGSIGGTTSGSIGGTASGSIGGTASGSIGGTTSGSIGGTASGSIGGTTSGTSSGSSGPAKDTSTPGTDTSGTDSQPPLPIDQDKHPSGGGGSQQGVWLESKLASLKSLPKTHYSWGVYYYQLLGDPNDMRFYHLARITHAFCVAGANIGPHQIDIAVYACAKSNKTNPGIPASIGVNLSPYHYRFGNDLPPTGGQPIRLNWHF
jgi:hypothetical protein